jgi:integrase/recombinase XerD
MKNNISSERHQNNNLNVMMEFAKYLDCDPTFYNINKKEMIIFFLDTKIKNSDNDQNIRWIMLKKKIIAL